MKAFAVIFALAAAYSSASIAQDLDAASFAFSEKNPITAATYKSQAQSYLVVKNNRVDKLPEHMRTEARMRAREFAAFTAGLFATYKTDELLACLSWQSFDEVVAKHASYASSESEPVKYPMLSAMLNLKFSCYTQQELDAFNKAFKERQGRERLSK